MNRRKAIGGLLLLVGAGTAAVSGVKFYQLRKTPDLSKLTKYQPLIAALAETIIPETDTPGARAAHADSFIIEMITECTPVREQNRFIEGLEDVTAYALQQYHRPFEKCTDAEQQAIAGYFEKRDRPFKGLAGKVSRRLLGDSFFVIMKKNTVKGYCNSMAGATRGLAYDYVPGAYTCCLTLQPGQKSWATQ